MSDDVTAHRENENKAKNSKKRINLYTDKAIL
jgi:hypothetical protein